MKGNFSVCVRAMETPPRQAGGVQPPASEPSGAEARLAPAAGRWAMLALFDPLLRCAAAGWRRAWQLGLIPDSCRRGGGSRAKGWLEGASRLSLSGLQTGSCQLCSAGGTLLAAVSEPPWLATSPVLLSVHAEEGDALKAGGALLCCWRVLAMKVLDGF